MSAIDIDQTRGECLVFSFKEGLLSAVAHDLKIRVTKWKLRYEPEGAGHRVRATFDATSLRVLTTMPHEGTIADKDRQTIDKHLVDDVLDARRYPTIELDATVDANLRLSGTLTLHGVAKPITTTLQKTDTDYRADLTVNQVDYRIKPFSAMLGTLKVKPDVRITLRVPTA